MTGWLVGIGVPVTGFMALVGSVWHHRGRNTGRHVAPTGTLSRDVHDATVPVRATEHGPPWEEAHEPDGPWIAELRAALDEVQPSGWVKPELGSILAAPTLAEPYPFEPPLKDHPNDVDSPNEWINAVLPMVLAEPSRLADTGDHASAAILADVAVFMAAQDADATRYGEDLAGWCAGQLRALRERL